MTGGAEGTMELTWIAVAGAFLLASFVKGTTAMGFPLIATPMVALLVDIKTTYALLVLPNILMDTFQIARGQLPWRLWRRLLVLLAATVVGVFLGTRILISVSERFIYVALAVMILVFLASVYLDLRIAVPPRWERSLGPAVGFAGGVQPASAALTAAETWAMSALPASAALAAAISLPMSAAVGARPSSALTWVTTACTAAAISSAPRRAGR